MAVRRFELHDYGANSHKFWELHLKDGCYHTEYGRIGGFGRAGSRSKSGQKCDGSYRRAIASKLKKGYEEVSAPMAQQQSPAPAPAPPRPTPATPIAPMGMGLLNWTGF